MLIIKTLKKMYFVLNSRQKRRLWVVLFLTLCCSVLELAGVSIILPVIEVIQDVGRIQTKWYLKMLYDLYPVQTDQQFIIALIVTVILFYIVKNVCLTLMYDVQYRFVHNNERRLSRSLLSAYLKRPYLYHVAHSSSEMIRNINDDSKIFFDGIAQVMHLFTESSVCFLFVCFLLYKDKTITICVMLSLLAFFVIFIFVVRKRIRKIGENVRFVQERRISMIKRSFEGIKAVKMLNKEQYFIDTYNEYSASYAKSVRGVRIYEVMPRTIMETVSVVALMSVIIFKVARGVDLNYFIPTLSVFAVAFIRLLPSFSRVTNAYNGLCYASPFVDNVYDTMLRNAEYDKTAKEEELRAEPLSFDKNIALEDIVFAYPGTEKIIIDHVSLEIPKNKSVALVGPSGGGKTTLSDIILGLLPPDNGMVTVDGKDIQSNPVKWHEMIGFIPQSIYLYDDTIRNNIAFGVKESEIDEERVINALKDASLYNFVMSLPDGLDTMVGDMGARLSGGQRQRIGIARALYTNPEILIMDEATSALDHDTETAVMESIASLAGRKTFVIIAHRLTTVRDCDEIYEVKDGNLRKVTYEEIVK